MTTPSSDEAPPRRRGGRRPTERKQDVVRAAAALFARRGVRQATVREIGASVGILSGSLYHHFGSKDDLVDHIVRTFTTDVLQRYDEIAAEAGDSETKLRAMARYAFSLLATAPDEMVIVADEYLYAHPDDGGVSRFAYVADFNAKVGQHWHDVLAAGVESGEFRSSAEPRLLYRVIRDAIIGATRWWVPSKNLSADDVADSIVDTVLRGIAVR